MMPSTTYRWLILCLLTLVQALSMADRQVIAILAPQIRDDLGVGNAEMGLLLGTMFGLFYALFSLPLGRLVDQWARPRLLSACLAGWSLMTLLSGMATNFLQLAAARLGLGLGEAAAQPVAMSWLADLYPPRQRGVIGASMTVGVAFGLGGAMWLGAAIANAWDSAYFIEDAPFGLRGWQAALVAFGLPGIVLAILIALLPDARRGVLDGEDSHLVGHRMTAPMSLAAALPISSLFVLVRQKQNKTALAIHLAIGVGIFLLCLALHTANALLRPAAGPLFELVGFEIDANDLQWIVFGIGLHALAAWSHTLRQVDPVAYAASIGKPAIRLLLAIIGLVMIVNYGITAWIATYVIEIHRLTPVSAGAGLALVMVVTGSLGPIISASLSEKLEAIAFGRGLRMTLLSFIISPLLFATALDASDSVGFFIWFGLYSLILTMWLPPLLAQLASNVPAAMRGTTASLYILMTTVFGMGLGPYIVGLLSDLPRLGMRDALLMLLTLFPVLVFLTVWLSRSLTREHKISS